MAYLKMQQDKGFAWVILVITLLYNIIQASVFMSPAIYLIAWDEAFDITKAELGSVASLMNGVACFTGIFVGPIVARYGCRLPSLLGTCICAFGMLTSIFVPTVSLLYLTYGGLTGMGLGLLGLPPIICVQYYFKKKRPFALGISLTGHSLGVLISLPLLQFGVDILGWRGALLLHTGVVLQCLVLGSLFLPIDISENEEKTEGVNKDKSDRNAVAHFTRTKQESSNSQNDAECQNEENSNVQIKLTGQYPQSEVQLMEKQSEDARIASQTNKSTEISNDRISNTYGNESQEKSCLADEKAETNCCPRLKLLRIINSLWNCSLLKNKAFVLFIFNVWVVEYCMGTFYKLMPLRALKEGVALREASFLPSVIAVMSVCFRVIVSIVANIEAVSKTVLCGLAVVGMGVTCCCSSLAYDFKTYAISCATFGMFLGSYISTVFIIMTTIVGIRSVAQAHSLLAMFVSTAMFASLPLAGLMMDLTGNYDLPFYIFGGLACLPGVLFLCMSRIFPTLRVKNTQNDDVKVTKA